MALIVIPFLLLFFVIVDSGYIVVFVVLASVV